MELKLVEEFPFGSVLGDYLGNLIAGNLKVISRLFRSCGQLSRDDPNFGGTSMVCPSLQCVAVLPVHVRIWNDDVSCHGAPSPLVSKASIQFVLSARSFHSDTYSHDKTPGMV